MYPKVSTWTIFKASAVSTCHWISRLNCVILYDVQSYVSVGYSWSIIRWQLSQDHF